MRLVIRKNFIHGRADLGPAFLRALEKIKGIVNQSGKRISGLKNLTLYTFTSTRSI